MVLGEVFFAGWHFSQRPAASRLNIESIQNLIQQKILYTMFAMMKISHIWLQISKHFRTFPKKNEWKFIHKTTAIDPSSHSVCLVYVEQLDKYIIAVFFYLFNDENIDLVYHIYLLKVQYCEN